MSGTIMGFPVAEVLEAEKVHARLVNATGRADVAEILRGVSYGAFRFLDEKPGYFPGNYSAEPWFAWMRQLRNDPTSDLFDHLT